MLLSLTLLLAEPAQSVEPMWRWLTVEQGLDPDKVTALVQSPDGRIWIGTATGVHVWEGGLASRADQGQIRKVILRLVALTDGRVVARSSAGELWVLGEGRPERLEGPSGGRVLDIAEDGAGQLMVLDKQGLYRWSEGQWQQLDSYERLHGSFRMREGQDGAMLLGGKEGWFLWKDGISVGLSQIRVHFPFDAAFTPEGNIWLLDALDQVRLVTPTGRELLRLDGHGNPRWLAVHDGELWWTSGDALHRYAPDHPLGLQELSFEISGQGPILIDQENSLWLGSHRGLGQIAEPGALELTPRTELGGMTGRSIAVDAQSVWLGTWQDAVHYDRATGRARRMDGLKVPTPVCLDAQGIAWGFAERAEGPMLAVAMKRGEEGFIGTWEHPGIGVWDGCETVGSGSVWSLSGGALWRNTLETGPVRLSESPVEPGYILVLYAKEGRVWAGGMNRVCQSTEAQILEGDPDWRCYALPELANVTSIVETEEGSVWAGGLRMGVMRLEDGAFMPHPAAAGLPSTRIMVLESSPSGGIWILGDAVAIRVRDKDSGSQAWTVLEDLNPRLGRAIGAPEGIVETAAGTLWIAGAAGLVSIERTARLEPNTLPGVRLSELRVDGTLVEGGPLTLPRPESSLSLRFTSPSYRAPRLLRYRLRLDGRPVGVPTDTPRFEFARLGPGTHQIQVDASLDGRNWSASPATLQVTVPRPWRARWETWFSLLAFLTAALGTALVLRQRVRLRIERLRSDIAMDLHDEVGAGLASVGLLGGLLQDELRPEMRTEVSTRIIETSSELGSALRSIVWSLQPSSQHVGALGVYLAERARGMFSTDGGQCVLHVHVPPIHQGPALDLDVLRAAQLIGLEALHNVTRHAQAREVHLTLEPLSRRLWRLSVRDDGVGIGTLVRSSVDSGHGLQSMARRAASVGAAFEVDSRPGHGTRVALTFSPSGAQS